jgi:glycerophosphoryl diester phosphodiesterase
LSTSPTPTRKNLQIIAHRCRGFGEQENSLPAFIKALASQVHELEIDVRITKDRELVVCHDPWFRDPSGRYHLISRLNLKEATTHGLMPLRTAIRLFSISGGDKRLALDIKSGGEEKQVIQLIGRYKISKKVVIISWCGKILERVHEAAPELALSFSFVPYLATKNYFPVFFNDGIPRFVTRKQIPLESVNIIPRLFPLNRKLVEKVRSLGIQVATPERRAPLQRKEIINMGVSRLLTRNRSSLQLS